LSKNSVLEEQAKTEEKIWYAYEQEVFNKLPQLHVNQRPEDWKIPKEMLQRISKKWVPFEVAQKEVKRFKIMGVKDCFRANMLEVKISEANKILAELDQLWTFKIPGNNTEMDLLILKLKSCLMLKETKEEKP
jgi:hypothetical protein